ncbi:MAG TPA: DUF6089 family protein [Puia sp.]|nr:DUF6089 family protein [Puia sp.]
MTGIILLWGASLRVMGQENAITQEGEFGISAGAAHYFGDLNPDSHLNRPKPSLGVFFRRQYGNYVALRVAGHFAQLGYSDIYNKQNQFELQRNLSFNTNIWELAVQGDFNFFKYVPGSESFRFTPYTTFGIGVFNYDPYAYYQGSKVFLRPLGTEGQGSALYPQRKAYGTMAVCFPLGVGFKYSLNAHMNLGFEVVYRFTTTDYIDDVSKTYAPDAQPHFLPDGSPTLWYALQDRSYETGNPIGIKDRQRGYQNQKDGYVLAEFSLTFNITSYRCPTAK